jgi:hypothetical protein
VVQYFLCPLLLAPGFISVVLSNTLYSAALCYYHYTQFLGYNGAQPEARMRVAPRADAPCAPPALPFLERTELFLYPIAGVALLTPFAILAGFNPSKRVLTAYFGVRALA